MQWATTSDKLRDDHEGALVHIAQNFAKWIQRVARAVTRHKKDIDTEEARRKSGSYGKHGLTDEEARVRQERLKARQNYYWALGLDSQLRASKGKGKSGAAEHTGGTGSSREDKHVIPKAWAVMSGNERWWMKELWSGNLSSQMRHAERKCYRVLAKTFIVNDDD